jgi:hypothetical protein
METSIFLNIVFFIYLEFLTIDKAQKLSNSELYTIAGTLRFYGFESVHCEQLIGTSNFPESFKVVKLLCTYCLLFRLIGETRHKINKLNTITL